MGRIKYYGKLSSDTIKLTIVRNPPSNYRTRHNWLQITRDMFEALLPIAKSVVYMNYRHNDREVQRLK